MIPLQRLIELAEVVFGEGVEYSTHFLREGDRSPEPVTSIIIGPTYIMITNYEMWYLHEIVNQE